MSALPENFDEFVASTVQLQCRECGEMVRRRWMKNSRCVGCRYGGDA